MLNPVARAERDERMQITSVLSKLVFELSIIALASSDDSKLRQPEDEYDVLKAFIERTKTISEQVVSLHNLADNWLDDFRERHKQRGLELAESTKIMLQEIRASLVNLKMNDPEKKLDASVQVENVLETPARKKWIEEGSQEKLQDAEDYWYKPAFVKPNERKQWTEEGSQEKLQDAGDYWEEPDLVKPKESLDSVLERELIDFKEYNEKWHMWKLDSLAREKVINWNNEIQASSDVPKTRVRNRRTCRLCGDQLSRRGNCPDYKNRHSFKKSEPLKTSIPLQENIGVEQEEW